MAVKILAVAFMAACLAQQGQSLGGSGASSSAVSTRSASVFFNAAASSSLANNIQGLNMSLASMQMSVDNLITDGQTQEIKDAVKFIKNTVGKFLKLAFKFTKALSNLATDKTVPVEELFEQFEKAADKLLAYMKKDESDFKQALKENLGVPVARDFETKWKKVKQELMNVIANEDRLKKAVLHIHHRDDDSQGESRANIAQLVTIFASSIAKMKSAVSDMASAVGSIATGLQTANTFLMQVIGTRNSTRASVKSTRADLRKALLMERKSALDKYYAAQSSIRSDLSSSITKLAIFSTSKKLNRLSRKFDDSYYDLYHFLRQRNRTDATAIGKAYHNIWENLEDVYDNSVEIFFYAMRRTYMRLADVVFESSFYNDYCYTTYTYSVPTKYQAINSLITDCMTREKSRWMDITTALKDEVKLLNSNSEELAMNIARCASYANFITTSADYNQAEACLKTNLEDMRELSFELKPLFKNLVNLVKSQVSPSKYRLENCFVSKLHELTALLKSTREAMNECGGRFDSSPRPGYEDEDSEWYDRHRGEICEKVEKKDKDKDGKDSGERNDSGERKGHRRNRDDIDQKPKKPALKCTKRPEDKNDKESGEQSSSEDNSGEKNKKNKNDKHDKKDKKDKNDKNSGERFSGEDSSDEKGHKKKKDKNKKDKDSGEKNNNKSNEYSSGEKGGGSDRSSEEVDSDEKKDKKKPGGGGSGESSGSGGSGGSKDSSEEKDCCKKDKDKNKDKNRSHERWSGENSEEEFDRKKVKVYSDNEEDIFNRKFGVVVPQKDVPVEAPVAPAAPIADGIMKRLLETPAAAEEEAQVDIAVKVVESAVEPEQQVVANEAAVDAA